MVTVAASWVWLSRLQARGAARDAAAAALYVANYRFALQRTDYLADASPSPLQHYWSLGVEEQFYLLWPLLLLVVFVAGRRLRTRSSAGAVAGLALAGAGSLALSLRLTARSAPWAFLSLPGIAALLPVGGTAAVLAAGAPPPVSVPAGCSAGGPSRPVGSCPTPGTCGTGHCWSWLRQWPAIPSGWVRTSA
jgi:peptidoglycan/LPS O-acetylase OafA/YrhL